MKKLLLFNLLLLPLFLCSQITLPEITVGDQQTEMPDSIKRIGAYINANKQNILYVGIYNPVSIDVIGIPEEEIKVTCANCIAKKYRGMAYDIYVKPKSQGKAQIMLHHNSEMIRKQAFRIEQIPNPVPMLGKHPGGLIGGGEFKAQLGVRAWLLKFPYDAKYEVLGYDMTYAPEKEAHTRLKNAGARFSEEITAYVQKAQTNDIYIFDSIQVKGPDKQIRMLSPIVYKIK